jgi:hypothetical protein
MKAVTFSRYGPSEVLKLDDMLRPEPKDGEVLIRVKAAEVTKADCEMRSFKFAVKWFWLPLRLAFGVRRPGRPVLGSYFAGEVVSTSKYPSRFTVGEQVFGCTQMLLGAHAEYNRIAPSTLRCRTESLTKLGRGACTIDSEFDDMTYPKRMKANAFSLAFIKLAPPRGLAAFGRCCALALCAPLLRFASSNPSRFRRALPRHTKKPASKGGF